MWAATARNQQAKPCGPGVPFRPFLDASYGLLERGGWKPLKKKRTDVIESEERRESGYILCAACGQRITRTTERIEIHGSHEHTFANPHGMIYRIGCFLNARGCIASYEESTQFSWFAGYAWRIEICRNCAVHLGWMFRSRETGFHGLILDRLMEEPEST